MRPIFLMCALLFVRCATAPDVEYYTSPATEGRPYSDAVRVGNMLYLSGQVGINSLRQAGRRRHSGETRQTMENIRADPRSAKGSSMDRVVKCRHMLADVREWAAMNEVYVTYFPPKHKARRAALLGANGLALGARVEIECWAVR